MFVANKVVKLMIRNGKEIKNANILILGFTFKENCPDIRNTRVIDIFTELRQFGTNVDVFDPFATAKQVLEHYNITLVEKLEKKYDAIILAVGHNVFLEMDIKALLNDDAGVIFDTKSIIDRKNVTARL